MRSRLAVALLALVAAGCGGAGSPSSVELTVGTRVDVGPTEDAYAGAGGIALDGNSVWTTKPNEGELLKIDGATGAILGRWQVCNAANDVGVGAGGVYVACESSAEVVRVDPTTGEVVDRVDVGVKALGLAVTDDAIWVSNREFDGLVRVDPGTMKVVARIDTGGVREGAWDVAATRDAVWVTTQGLVLVRIDPVTNEVSERIPTVTTDVKLSLGWVAADEENVWLTNPGSLGRLDPQTNEFTDVIDLAASGATHAQARDDRVWISTAREVVLVDASSRSVVGRVPVVEGSGAAGLRAIAPAASGAWVLDPDDGEVVEVRAAEGDGG